MDTTTAKVLALRVSVKLGTDEQEALQFIWLGCVDGALRPMYEDGEPFPVHAPTEEMEPVVDLWGRRLPRAYAAAKNLATTFEDFEQVSHILRFQARDADDFLAYLDTRAIERAAEATPHAPAAASEPEAGPVQVRRALLQGKTPQEVAKALANLPPAVVAAVLDKHMPKKTSLTEIGRILAGGTEKTCRKRAKELIAAAPKVELV